MRKAQLVFLHWKSVTFTSLAVIATTVIFTTPTSAQEPASEGAPYVGAYAGNTGSSSPQTEWDKAQKDIGDGKLTYRRSFDNKIPDVGKEAWRKVNAPRQWYSVKPPKGDYRGFIDGKYDEKLRAVAKELPTGTTFTMFHEPEDNMSGKDFYAMFKRMYDIVKAERPTGVQVWYVAMAYQWETNSKGNTGSNDGWVDAARIADGVGLDIYASHSDFTKIQDDKGFLRWWEQIQQPSAKPWGIIERGIDDSKGEEARLDTLKADWAFVKSNGGYSFMYWQSNIDANWTLTGEKEKEFYRSVAAEGQPVIRRSKGKARTK